MNVQRAQEIASSSIMANVLCDGLPIYIQHVNEQRETARIYALNNPEEEREVPLYALTERDQTLE
ncbi:H-type small acid-soluble spore protein [Paenibacillus sp. SEL3]|jgi:small acid-soluble spore protein H (minor)|uniref:H-type small acid-soluble spore protein n=1 Tax=Paenibacillus polymyxa TaxID=1406 RepID=A0A074LB47_PAEPO|nr:MULTISPECIES: H-type small acid-soluble spore protein [Paenibacillus]AHM68042.1 small acid-soluble spore protein [Paenibacillus polymyxa SQR-21]AIY08746.1 spore protein H [Paenibacillus polymyxa]AUS28683.1 acid-soluble spore protein H [Paenibacillus polymyxa]KAE8561583.1 small, acid-soluble spore protein, H family [Paenibacillus polymyxa]KAF6571421.1 H-type small acid-soluble spore protein [Paenibacillus sp. EKM206P]